MPTLRLFRACLSRRSQGTYTAPTEFEPAELIALQEAKTDQIDLPDDDPNILFKLINYLYVLNYDNGVTLPSPPVQCADYITSQLAIHVSVYFLADKYGVNGLTKLATSYIMTAFKERQSQISSPMLDSTRFSNIAPTMEKIYDSVPSTGDVLWCSILAYLKEEWKSFIKVPAFQDFLLQRPDVSVALLEHASKPPPAAAPVYSPYGPHACAYATSASIPSYSTSGYIQYPPSFSYPYPPRQG